MIRWYALNAAYGSHSGANLVPLKILRAFSAYFPPSLPASLLQITCFTTPRLTARQISANFSKSCSAYLPILLLLTSQLILLSCSSERKLQQSAASSLRSPQVHCAALLLHAFSLPPLGPCPYWPLTVSKVSKFLTCSRLTTCPLEPIQTIRRTITSAFTHLINSSLSTRHLTIYIQSGWGDITTQEIPIWVKWETFTQTHFFCYCLRPLREQFWSRSLRYRQGNSSLTWTTLERVAILPK